MASAGERCYQLHANKSYMAAQGPATPSALYKMISIPEAQKVVLKETKCLPSVSRPLSEAQGCILAEDVHAPEDVPPFPASIKVQCPCCWVHKSLPQLRP